MVPFRFHKPWNVLISLNGLMSWKKSNKYIVIKPGMSLNGQEPKKVGLDGSLRRSVPQMTILKYIMLDLLPKALLR